MKAGLENADHAFIAGGLLALRAIPVASEQYGGFRKAGRDILNRPASPSPAAPLSNAVRDVAKRREEAHRKIVLGGLIVKFGLRNADRAFLMGGLTALAALPVGSEQFLNLRRVGQEALSDAPSTHSHSS